MTNTQRAAPRPENYYEAKGDQYFERRAGARSDRVQRLRSQFFQGVAADDLTILDFGCGTGGILRNLPAGKRVGVEIGARAAAEAKASGIEVYSSLSKVPPGSIDVAISFHALEHVDRPLDVLREILVALKPGGRARLVVPCETPTLTKQRSWRPNDDQHLYTWTPLNFGNLAARAGFERIESRLAPMPSASRTARWFGTESLLGRGFAAYRSLRNNSYNVVLDAVAPM
jgi:SAM-dependent methyltransferase